MSMLMFTHVTGDTTNAMPAVMLRAAALIADAAVTMPSFITDAACAMHDLRDRCRHAQARR